MSDDVNADFGRLQQTAQIGASGFDATKTHPVFGALHSFALSHKYGQADPYTYMRNPNLRAMDTRAAAFQGMQKLGEGVRRAADMYRPSIPGPVPPMPSPTPTAPTNPSQYTRSTLKANPRGTTP